MFVQIEEVVTDGSNMTFRPRLIALNNIADLVEDNDDEDTTVVTLANGREIRVNSPFEELVDQLDKVSTVHNITPSTSTTEEDEDEE